MSWHYLQEAEEEFSAELYLAGLRSARSKSNLTPEMSSSPVNETDSSHGSRFGTMSQPSTGNPGEVSSMSSPAGSPAKTSHVPGKVQELTEPAPGYGPKCAESFAKYDRNSRSWKTHQCSLFADWDESLETFPKSGMMCNGKLYPRSPWEPLTDGTESGFLRETLQLCPTPTCRGLDGGAHARSRLRHLFPTPTACNAPNTNANTTGPHSLLEVAQTNWSPGETWPTPQASDFKRAGDSLETILHRKETGHQMGLPETVRLRMLPTPTCQDAKNNGSPSQQARNSPPLNAVLGGKLNPMWVEWLMGWPLGWTDSKPLETAKFRSWLQLHFSPS